MSMPRRSERLFLTGLQAAAQESRSSRAAVLTFWRGEFDALRFQLAGHVDRLDEVACAWLSFSIATTGFL